MEYNKLATEIHQDQINAGWYNEYRSDNTLILLIKSELFEAFEAYRKYGTPSPYSKNYLDKTLTLANGLEREFKLEFEESIKDGFADELADTVIRLLDFAGYKRMCLFPKNESPILFDSVLSYLIALDLQLTMLYSDFSEESISDIIFDIENLANLYKIDLERHIKLKLAYNKTRGKRHGNKAV